MSVVPYATPDWSRRPLAEGKRFLRVIPLAFITYSLAYLDRVNYGFAATGGLPRDLHISPEMNARLPAIFFIGYFLFQVPGTAYAAHRSVRKLTFWALLLWGLLSTATGLVRSVSALIVIRFLLGVVEGVVYPSMLVFVSHWFTRKEKSRANTLLILGNPVTVTWASVVSGYLIEYFQAHRVGGLMGWQMMFVIEGVPSVVWAVFWWFLAADHPRDAGWLSGAEAEAIQGALDEEQKGLTPAKNYRAAFGDPRVLLLCAQFLFWSIGIYGFVFWVPTIIQTASKKGIGATGLLTAVPYLVGIVAMLCVSHFSDRTLRRKVYVWPTLLLGAGFSLLVMVPGSFWVVYLGLIVSGACMYAPYGPYWAMVPEMVPRNVVGESMALINSAGAVGGFFGAYVVGWLNGVGGSPAAAAFTSACLVVSAILTMVIDTRPRDPAPPERGFEVLRPAAAGPSLAPPAP